MSAILQGILITKFGFKNTQDAANTTRIILAFQRRNVLCFI